MGEHEILRSFEEEMMRINDVRVYLKASPHESGERTALDKRLSKDLYYNSFYANSYEADALIAEINEKIATDDTHNFILSGYKGCGKSTFVGYFLRNADARNLTINFDVHWDPDEGIVENIVMFLCKKILNDILPKDGSQPCCIANKYLELFRMGDNADYIDRNVDWKNYFRYFGDKLLFAVMKCEDRKTDTRKYIDTDIKPHIASGTIASMMTLLVFWDLADRIAHNKSKKCYIVFENLDVIYNTSDVPKLVQNVVAFRNNIDRISESLYYQGEPISDPTQDYILIFVMRETTKAEFSNCIDHFSDRKIRFYTFRDISNIYNLYDIVSKRTQFLEDIKKRNPNYLNSESFRKMLNAVGNIKYFLSDTFVRKNLYAIFDNDYRTCIEALSCLNFNHPKIIKAYTFLQSAQTTCSEENWPTYGSRCIIFREVFNMLVHEGYSGLIRKSEYSVFNNDKIESINLDRMILLYLANSVNLLGPSELLMPEYVSLDTLFSEILKFCDKPDIIVEALWNLYDLRKERKWNHLVTFDDMQHVDYYQLKNEMSSVVNKNTDVQFSKVRITIAGQVYLNFILPHFEYYAARSKAGNGFSLFTYSAEELCNMDNINSLIKAEIKEISDCCTRLYYFSTEILDSINEFKGKRFLDTKFAVKKYSESRNAVYQMYHGEKIAYSSIGYLDSFRFFTFFTLDQALKKGRFDTNIDLTKHFKLIPHISRSFQATLPSELFTNAVKATILKRPMDEGIAEVQEITIQNTDGTTSTINIHFSQVITLLKICMNKRIIDNITAFMRLLGFCGGQQRILCSDGSSKICTALEACVKYRIAPSEYTDFTTRITTLEGERILYLRGKQARQQKQEERRIKSKERKEQIEKNDSEKSAEIAVSGTTDEAREV